MAATPKRSPSAGSEHLRALFKTKIVTQARLAATLTIKQQAISSWLRGAARPSLEHMLAIQRLYNVPVQSWADPPPRKGASAEPTAAFPGDGQPADGGALRAS